MIENLIKFMRNLKKGWRFWWDGLLHFLFCYGNQFFEWWVRKFFYEKEWISSYQIIYFYIKILQFNGVFDHFSTFITEFKKNTFISDTFILYIV